MLRHQASLADDLVFLAGSTWTRIAWTRIAMAATHWEAECREKDMETDCTRQVAFWSDD